MVQCGKNFLTHIPELQQRILQPPILFEQLNLH